MGEKIAPPELVIEPVVVVPSNIHPSASSTKQIEEPIDTTLADSPPSIPSSKIPEEIEDAGPLNVVVLDKVESTKQESEAKGRRKRKVEHATITLYGKRNKI